MEYTYRCIVCRKVKTVSHGMLEEPAILCSCAGRMRRVITGTAHVALNWKMPTSADDGHNELAIHASRNGVPSPKSQWAGKRT